MRNGDVIRRLAELRAPAVKRVSITLESLLEDLEECKRVALANKQVGAAVAAIKEQGILTGNRVEKRENTNRNTDVRDLTERELLQQIAELEERAASEAQSARVTH